MGTTCCKNNKESHQFLSLYSDQYLNLDPEQSQERIRKLLRKFHRLRQSVIQCRGTVQSLTGLPLNQPRGLLQNLQVLLWALSRQFKGRIADTYFQISDEFPFLYINDVELPRETEELFDSLREYLEIIMTGCQKMDKILQGLSMLSPELRVNKPKERSETDREKSRELDYQQLVIEMKEAEIFTKDLHYIKTKADAIISKIQELQQTCDQIGFVAFQEGLEKPEDIAMKYSNFLERGTQKVFIQRKDAEDSPQSEFREVQNPGGKFSFKKSFFETSETPSNRQETGGSGALLTTRETTNFDQYKQIMSSRETTRRELQILPRPEKRNLNLTEIEEKKENSFSRTSTLLNEMKGGGSFFGNNHKQNCDSGPGSGRVDLLELMRSQKTGQGSRSVSRKQSQIVDQNQSMNEPDESFSLNAQRSQVKRVN